MLLPVIAALVAAGLLWLAVPRTVAAFAALPADWIADRLYRGRTVEPSQIDRVIGTRAHALSWVDSPPHHLDLARAHFARGIAGGRPGGGPDIAALDRAVAAAREAVTRSPADPWPWGELARAQHARPGGATGTVPVFSTAMVLGPDWPGAPFRNLDLGLALWPSLGTDDRTLLFRQARLAWTRSRPHYVGRATTPLRAASRDGPP